MPLNKIISDSVFLLTNMLRTSVYPVLGGVTLIMIGVVLHAGQWPGSGPVSVVSVGGYTWCSNWCYNRKRIE